MIYRPQFPYPIPEDCHPQRCHYTFDSTNTPSFAGMLPSGNQTSAIPLQMDKDADFLLRAWQMASDIMYRLIDPYNNALSDEGNVEQLRNFQRFTLSSATTGASPVALESQTWGIYCPAGSNFNLFLYNQTDAAVDISATVVVLHGVKMYGTKRCAE
jgi:hypothetical protein